LSGNEGDDDSEIKDIDVDDDDKNVNERKLEPNEQRGTVWLEICFSQAPKKQCFCSFFDLFFSLIKETGPRIEQHQFCCKKTSKCTDNKKRESVRD